MNLRSFTLYDLITRNGHLYGDRIAFIDDHHRVSHAQFAQRSARLAAGLATLGLGRGDRIAVLAGNSLAYVDIFGAAARLGALVVPINVRLSPEEIAHILADVSPTILVAAPDLRALLPASLTGIRCLSMGSSDTGWPSLETAYSDHPSVDPAANTPSSVVDTDGLVIIHTAAVGGKARGAVLTHRGLLSASASALLSWRLQPDDVNMGVLPLYHVAGLGLLLAAQHAGAASVIMPRFDADVLVRSIDQEQGSIVATFAPMLASLIDAAAKCGSSLASLRIVTGLEAPDTVTRLQSAHPGTRFFAIYGQTETSGMVTMSAFDERPGSAGRPSPLNTVVVLDDQDRALPSGQTGEIAVRGPMVFEGYWGLPDDSAHTLRNGWHHTGDMGRFDEQGYLWYQGRSPAKELIKPGGENVYPAEVERTLCEHPAVAAAVVFGVPDAHWGEAVSAVCELKTGQTVSAEALSAFVAERIARYKRPKHVQFVAQFPKAANGSVDRAAVKKQFGAS